MRFLKHKQNQPLSRNEKKSALALAVELYNKVGYEGEEPIFIPNSFWFDSVLDELEKEDDAMRYFGEPRLGLPGYTETKLIIEKSYENKYGFNLRILLNDLGTSEAQKQSNLEAKIRIEEAWKSHGLPFEAE